MPLAATGLLDMITIVLAGKRKPTESQLKRLLGARKNMMRDLIDYKKYNYGNVAKGFTLAHKASTSKANLDTYRCDGSVPPEVLDGC